MQPHVPGMSATNLVVRLDSEPGIAATKVAEEKMKQTDQEVLEDPLRHVATMSYISLRFVPWTLVNNYFPYLWSAYVSFVG